MPDEDLIDSAEARAILGIDKGTLSRWVATGRITPAARVGGNGWFLFNRADVTALAATRAAAEQTA